MPRIALPLLLLTCSLDARALMCIGPGGPSSIPALDQIGLMGLSVIVGLAAGWIIKRRK